MISTVVGSTGLTGTLLIEQLLNDSTITKVISVARKSLNISSAKLTEIRISDFAELPGIESKIRGDFYFCCLGSTIKSAGSKENFKKIDQTAILDFAKIAKAHDAKSFVLISSMGADANSIFFYNQVKGRTENELQALGLRSLVIFRPALLVGSRREFRLTEKIAIQTIVPVSKLFSRHAQKRMLTQAKTLAARMLAEAKVSPKGLVIIEAKNI